MLLLCAAQHQGFLALFPKPLWLNVGPGSMGCVCTMDHLRSRRTEHPKIAAQCALILEGIRNLSLSDAQLC